MIDLKSFKKRVFENLIEMSGALRYFEILFINMTNLNRGFIQIAT